MATDVIYASSGGYLISNHATYATAAAGATFSSGTPFAQGGQRIATTYYLYEGFLAFDTSPVGSDDISSATLNLYCNSDQTTTDCTLELRLYNWGGTLQDADWRTPANLGGYTLLAHRDTSGMSTGRGDFTNDGLIANIAKTGTTYMVLASDRFRAGTAPTGSEYASFISAGSGTLYDARLTIIHAPAGPPPRSQAVVIV